MGVVLLLVVFLFLLLLAWFAGIVRPFIRNSQRWQFALGAAATFVLLMAVAPATADGGAAAKSPSLAPLPFFFLFLACVIGAIYPFVPSSKRWHFALGAVASLVGLGVTVPKPTAEDLAAREAEEAQEAAEEARQEASEGHQTVVAKARPALEGRMNYTRAEYGDTYARVGAATFAKLDDLEPGAAYAAAESNSCNRVNAAMVSDTSKPGAAVWFVDCANERRFMISQRQAADALARFKDEKLALRDLEPNCTLSSVADCELSPAQRAAKDKEVEFVSACDLILQAVVVSPSSLDMHRWRYGFADDDTVVIERPFDSENSFGAMIRSSYRCEIDATTTKISGFVVKGPMGNQKVI